MHESHSPAPPPAGPDPLAFTPVPCARHDGWTPRRQQDFIQALAVMGAVSRAAKAVGMSKQSAYKLREHPDAAGFAGAWDLALMMGYDRQLETAMDRALNGIVTPRVYKGKQIGTRHRYDDRLAMAVLAGPAARPSFFSPAPQQSRKKVAR